MEERWQNTKYNMVGEDSNVRQYFSNARTEFYSTSRRAGNPFYILSCYAMRPH